jgi:hypothetical protein
MLNKAAILSCKPKAVEAMTRQRSLATENCSDRDQVNQIANAPRTITVADGIDETIGNDSSFPYSEQACLENISWIRLGIGMVNPPDHRSGADLGLILTCAL